MSNTNIEFPFASFALTRPVQLASPTLTSALAVPVDDTSVESSVGGFDLELFGSWTDSFPDSEKQQEGVGGVLWLLAQTHIFLLDQGDLAGSDALLTHLHELGLLPGNSPYAALKELVASSEFQSAKQLLDALLLDTLERQERLTQRLTTLIRCLTLMGLLRKIVADPDSVDSAQELADYLLSATVLLPKGRFPRPASALARPPAIADLLVVRQRLARYEFGEVAHIENVLAKEKKDRVLRRLDQREETVTTETESERTDERDNQSTERFELQKEVSSATQQSVSAGGGLEVSASYGPTVSVTASANVAVTWAQQEASRVASNYAKETTERAATKVRQRTLERRSVRTLTTTEETNTHTIDNTAQSSTNISGVYRWVDKIYKAQVYRYGRRLMLEFILPEPAALARQAILSAPLSGVTATNPSFPSVSNRNLLPSDLTEQNYLQIAAPYFVRELATPPAKKSVSLAWDQSAERAANKFYFRARKEVQIPDGYEAEAAEATVAASAFRQDVSLCVGTTVLRGDAGNVSGGNGANGATPPLVFASTPLKGERGDIPVSLVIENVWEYAVTLVVTCKPTAEAHVKWQLATYAAIMAAYFEMKSTFESQVRAAENNRGIAIQGRNPLENDAIQRAELKRGVISQLSSQHFDAPPLDQDAVRAVAFPGNANQTYLDVDFDVAAKERDHIQWYEQAFEWQNMTYVYYPYFWSRKSEWLAAFQTAEVDPAFKQFLTAGAARVQIPVRPGFEKAMTLFLATGWIWTGTAVPQVGDPLYVSILQEVKEQQDPLLGGVAVGSAWDVRLPTSFVMLQADSSLPEPEPAQP